MKVISARFPDYCRYCDEPVRVGTSIVWIRAGILFHYQCYFPAAKAKEVK